MSYVDQIFQALGGSRKIATGLGYAESTVRSWAVRGSIPDPQKVEVLRFALQVGISLRPEDFFPDQRMLENSKPDAVTSQPGEAAA